VPERVCNPPRAKFCKHDLFDRELPMETMTSPDFRCPHRASALGTWAIWRWMWGGSDDSRAIRTIQPPWIKGSR